MSQLFWSHDRILDDIILYSWLLDWNFFILLNVEIFYLHVDSSRKSLWKRAKVRSTCNSMVGVYGLWADITGLLWQWVLLFSFHKTFLDVSVIHRRRKLFTLSSFPSEPLNQFQTNLAKSILGQNGLRCIQMKNYTFFFKGDISEIAKIRLTKF